MKRYYKIMPILFATVLSMSVFATEQENTANDISAEQPVINEQNQDKSFVTEDGYEYIPDSQKYKTSLEADPPEKEPEPELPETNVYGGYATYQEYLEATKQTELTQEQIDAGMVLNEYGQVENPNEGEEYNEIIFGGVNPGKNTGYVDIQLATDAEIHEEVYVYVMNMNTYRMYGCNLYEINSYVTQLCLPAGNYIVQEAGLTLDTVGRFYTYNRQFTVERDSTQILEVVLIDSQAAVKQEEEQEQVQPEVTETPQEEEQPQVVPETTQITAQDELVKKPQVSIFSVVAAILIIVGFFFILYKMFPPKPKHEFKGFD